MTVFDRVGTDALRTCPELRRRGQPERRSATHLFPRAIPGVAGVVATILLTVIAVAQPSPTWRYDLRAGDHLIYHYTFHKTSDGPDDQTQVDASFRTHVLVASENARRITLGFQRNREAADLTQYVSKGKDKLAKERIDFQKRMQLRSSRFSEAMEISSTGEPYYAWEIARETYSHIIDALHEVITLPAVALAKGETWRGGTTLGFDLRWVDDETIHGKPCHHIEGTSPKGSLKLSYWWSPESGVLEQIVLDGTYSNYGSTVHETARMEIEDRKRGESIDRWLQSLDTREGALQAILLTPEIAISAEQLASTLSSDDTAAQALALAIALHRSVGLSPAIIRNLQQKPSTLIETELRLLAESQSNASKSNSSNSRLDECHRPLPQKSSHAKLGTTFEIAPAAKGSPEVPYLVRVPLSYHDDQLTPLLIYLSGGAGFALDAMNSAQDVVSQTDYIVLYPQAAAYWWTSEVASRFNTVLDDVLKRYNVDRDRVYITGFSNGGTGALYYATLWPQRFAAVVTQMGAGVCNEQIKAGLANVKNIPLLLIHGENDPIIISDCSTTTQAAVKDLHRAIAPELKILPKHGHDITLQSDDGLTLAFFKNKIRNPFPRTVDLTQTSALASRAYWIEIMGGKPGKSDIDARIKPDNAIEIHSHEVRNIRLHLRPELLSTSGDIRIAWNGKRISSGPLGDVCSLPAPSSNNSIDDPKLDRTDTRELVIP
jgi:dienelactone hydrolase